MTLRNSLASAIATSRAAWTFCRSCSAALARLALVCCTSARTVCPTVSAFFSAVVARSFAAVAAFSAALALASASDTLPVASESSRLSSSSFLELSSTVFLAWATSSFFFTSSAVSFLAWTTRTSLTSWARCSAAAFHSKASRSAFCTAPLSFSTSLALQSKADRASFTSLLALSAAFLMDSTSLRAWSFSCRRVSSWAEYWLLLFSASSMACWSFLTWPSAS
mmetsp:Transcript_31002/g.71605  ORF Transcript_31002/g.71605 Transcript_31002/m.71605 type:complete len:223 (-) Transcript_31002:1283-1951(-)